MADNTSRRGFAGMDPEEAEDIQSMGGQASPTKFQKGSQRAQEAGRKGGEARAREMDSEDYEELGRMGGMSRGRQRNRDDRSDSSDR